MFDIFYYTVNNRPITKKWVTAIPFSALLDRIENKEFSQFYDGYFKTGLKCLECYEGDLLVPTESGVAFSCENFPKSVWLTCSKCFWCGYPFDYLARFFRNDFELIKNYLFKRNYKFSFSLEKVKNFSDQVISKLQLFKKFFLFGLSKGVNSYHSFLEDNAPLWWTCSLPELQLFGFSEIANQLSSDSNIIVVPGWDSLGRILSLTFFSVDLSNQVIKWKKVKTYRIGNFWKGIYFNAYHIPLVKFITFENSNSSSIRELNVVDRNFDLYDLDAVFDSSFERAIGFHDASIRNNKVIFPFFSIKDLQYNDLYGLLGEIHNTYKRTCFIVDEVETSNLSLFWLILVCLTESSVVDYRKCFFSSNAVNDCFEIFRKINLFYDKENWKTFLLNYLRNLKDDLLSVVLDALNWQYKLSSKVISVWPREFYNKCCRLSSHSRFMIFTLAENWTLEVTSSGLVRRETGNIVCDFIPYIRLTRKRKNNKRLVVVARVLIHWPQLNIKNVFNLSVKRNETKEIFFRINDLLLGKVDYLVWKMSNLKKKNFTPHPFVRNNLFSIGTYLYKNFYKELSIS